MSVGQLGGYEVTQALQVLAVQFHIIVSSTLKICKQTTIKTMFRKNSLEKKGHFLLKSQRLSLRAPQEHAVNLQEESGRELHMSAFLPP